MSAGPTPSSERAPIASTPIALSPIAVSMGDPAGIGPEIACLAWSRLRAAGPAFFVIGDSDALSAAARTLGQTIPLTAIENAAAADGVFRDALPVLSRPAPASIALGKPNSANGRAVADWIAEAARLAAAGEARAVVTCPIAKAVMHEAGFAFPGHTEYLADLVRNAPQPEPRGPVMMLTGGGVRVALVTIHEPLAAVAALLSVDAIVRTARIVERALREDFGVARPRIGLLGLNPHAGESGDLGREEIEIINPAAALLRAEHDVDISDALPGDTAFAPHERDKFDAFVAMYHDQGLIPVKTLDFDGGVNITLGLPIVRTSPDHGTAFAIAGKGKARPDSLLAAIALADQISAQRAAAMR